MIPHPQFLSNGLETFYTYFLAHLMLWLLQGGGLIFKKTATFPLSVKAKNWWFLSKMTKGECIVDYRVVCPFFLLGSVLRIIDDAVVINKLCQAYALNNLQCKVDVGFNKFDSSNFTKFWEARHPIQNYVDCIMPLQWIQTHPQMQIIQNNIYFN